jgi:hypothetical protein
MALAACRRSPGDLGRFGQLAVASGALTVISFSQGGSATLLNHSMASAAAPLLTRDINGLPCPGIRGVVADAAPPLSQRRDVGFMAKIDGRPPQSVENVHVLQTVDRLLGLHRRKDRGS